MDHLWEQEAEREMTRRFTTPLLPLKLVDGKVGLPPVEPRTKKPPPTSPHMLKTQVKSTTRQRAAPTNSQHRPAETRILTPREQTLSRRNQNPKLQSDAKSRDPGIDLPPAPADRPLNDFIQDLNKDLIQRRSSASRTNSNTKSTSTARDQSGDIMRDKIARSAAAVEDSLPFYLGYKRKDPAVRFQEQPDIVS